MNHVINETIANRMIGYARVSKYEQNLEMQVDALLKSGCSKKYIFTDKISGTKAERIGLQKCLAELKRGDILIVWRLDRLGRSLSHLINIITELQEKGIGFKSLCDGHIDTTTASGECVFNILSSLAQFERKLIIERTNTGLARARGIVGGRKKMLDTDPKIVAAKRMHQDHNISIHDICDILKISRSTFYRYLQL